MLPPLDPELAVLVSDELVAHGVQVETARLASVEERTVTLADGRVLPADLVVGAIGVRPDVRLAEAAGLDLGRAAASRSMRRTRPTIPTSTRSATRSRSRTPSPMPRR